MLHLTFIFDGADDVRDRLRLHLEDEAEKWLRTRNASRGGTTGLPVIKLVKSSARREGTRAETVTIAAAAHARYEGV